MTNTDALCVMCRQMSLWLFRLLLTTASECDDRTGSRINDGEKKKKKNGTEKD